MSVILLYVNIIYKFHSDFFYSIIRVISRIFFKYRTKYTIPWNNSQNNISKCKFHFFIFFKKFIFTLFYFTILYWFCHTLTWIRHGCTWVPKHEPPSHLPPHIISLDHPCAPALSILYLVSNIDWRFVSYMIVHMFQCHSPYRF